MEPRGFEPLTSALQRRFVVLFRGLCDYDELRPSWAQGTARTPGTGCGRYTNRAFQLQTGWPDVARRLPYARYLHPGVKVFVASPGGSPSVPKVGIGDTQIVVEVYIHEIPNGSREC